MNGPLPSENAEGGTGSPTVPYVSRLAVRAEQALLGAVMAEPVHQAAVLNLVRPADMYRPYHGQVLAAMQRLQAKGVVPGPGAVRAELALDPDLPRQVALDGVLLADLLEAAPRSDHAPAYAAMVIGHSVRQQVVLAGSRMTQAAQSGDLDAALWLTAQASRDVLACQTRWAALPEPIRRELPRANRQRESLARDAATRLRSAGEEIARLRREVQVGAATDLAWRLESIAGHLERAAFVISPAYRRSPRLPEEPGPTGSAAEITSGLFLRDLAAGPAQISAVRDWLSPSHFVNQDHGHLYALIRDMHAVGQPIDPVSIAWQATGRGIQIDAADLEGGTAPFAVARAREVHRHGLLCRISRLGRNMQAAAADPQVQTSVLLRVSGDCIRSLQHEPAPSGHLEPSDTRLSSAARTATLLAPDAGQMPRRPRTPRRPRPQGDRLTAEPA